MAITLSKYPTSPNLVNGYQIYSVSSNQTTQPQFQFVMDIKTNGGQLIQRIKQQTNPNNRGLFDIGRILTTQFNPTDEVWKIQNATTNTNCAQQFKVFFGEEYGTSVSSSVTLYNGAGSAGNPAVTGSFYYFELGGTQDPNNLENWNWQSGSKYIYTDTQDETEEEYQFGLTNFDTSSIRDTDYHTISFLNGNFTGQADAAVTSDYAMDVYIMRVQEYNITGSLTNTMYWYNADYGSGNGGPRTSPSQLWVDCYDSQSASTRLIHFPAGPANFLDDGNPLDPNTTYYTCDFFDQNTSGSLGSKRWGSYTFNIENNCDYEGTRFAWKNEYGVWDYYNFTLVQTANTDVERNSYQQSYFDFGGSTATYDKQRRGESQYYNKLTEKYTAESNWLNQSDADNLRELFYSANVYVQSGSEFLPIVITNTNVVQKKNIVGQKLFKYTAEYQYANNLIGRR